MPTPSYNSKNNAKVEMDARYEARSGGDEFRLWVETDDKMESVWQGEYPGQTPVPEEFGEPDITTMTWIFKELERLYITEARKKSEEGLKPTIFQIIASFQSQGQEYINFGEFSFNNSTKEEFKDWAIEEFEAEFKDIVKLSCEWRGLGYVENRPQWFDDDNGKLWWHENTCQGCQSVFVDVTNPLLCGHCMS